MFNVLNEPIFVGKKGQTGTPIPSKSAGNKSKEQTPKSAAAQLSCKSCSKYVTIKTWYSYLTNILVAGN